MLLQLLAGLLLQILYLRRQPLEMPVIRTVSEFLRCEVLAFGRDREPGKEECEGGQAEEGFLCLLAELVHGLADDRKVD